MAYLIVKANDLIKFVAAYDLDRYDHNKIELLGTLKNNYPSLNSIPITSKDPESFRKWLKDNIFNLQKKMLYFEDQLKDLDEELNRVGI